ncbi:MAG: hypothetical protein WAN17_09780 [Candidatus Sulfotelmatobacter sp.]
MASVTMGGDFGALEEPSRDLFFDDAKSLASSGFQRNRVLGMSLPTKVMA